MLLIRTSVPFCFPVSLFIASCHLWESDLRSGATFSRIYLFLDTRRAETTLFLNLFPSDTSPTAWRLHRFLIIILSSEFSHGLSVSQTKRILTGKNSLYFCCRVEYSVSTFSSMSVIAQIAAKSKFAIHLPKAWMELSLSGLYSILVFFEEAKDSIWVIVLYFKQMLF